MSGRRRAQEAGEAAAEMTRRDAVTILAADFIKRTAIYDVDSDRELAWQDRALCAETDPEIFFPEKGGTTAPAKKVCRSCDVRAECLEYALDHDEGFGVFGGFSERERRQFQRSRPRQRQERAKPNVRPGNARPSRFPGVTWQGNRWTARWTPPGGERVYLGSFPSEEAAAEAIAEARAARRAASSVQQLQKAS